MGFENLMPIFSKLQETIFQSDFNEIDFPSMAIVGSQSSGKSSIIENIVGKDFLPRGTGIVTRRPLIIQLINFKLNEQSEFESPLSSNSISSNLNEIYSLSTSVSSITDERILKEVSTNKNMRNDESIFSLTSTSEWGEFCHLPGKKFFDFSEIKNEIEEETRRVAGKNKEISSLPINLKIFSNKVVNLTLIDLPGLTKIPVGDQPTDIENQIKRLILEYISRSNCIILAVLPANVDLANSESLKLARLVDPVGKRTLGILSKLDLMDHGTNALEIIKGNLYPLKLGFIGVINRSQYDIDNNKSMKDFLEFEHEFFKKNHVYNSVIDKCGIQNLARILNSILMNHIKEKLPEIRSNLYSLLSIKEKELSMFGPSYSILNETKETRSAKFLTIMTRFSNSFINSIDGIFPQGITTNELCGGARIYFIFNEIYGSKLSLINPMKNLNFDDIKTAIKNSTGSRPSLFVPESAFDLLVKPQINLLEDPSRHCVELIYEELMKIVHLCSHDDRSELKNYPIFQEKLLEVVNDLLKERLGPTIKYVESLIEIQKSYINTNHPNFIGPAKAMSLIIQEYQNCNNFEKKKNHNMSLDLVSKNTAKNKGLDLNLEDDIANIDINDNDHDLINENVSLLKSDTGKQQFHYDSFLNYFFGKESYSNQSNLQSQLKSGSFLSNNLIKQHSVNHNDLNSLSLHDLQIPASKTENFNHEYGNSLFKSENQINQFDEKERLECELIRRLIISYFQIVREIIQDQVPKSIMCLLVNYIKDNIQNRLVVKLYNETLISELLIEDKGIEEQRNKCIKSIESYKKALKVIEIL